MQLPCHIVGGTASRPSRRAARLVRDFSERLFCLVGFATNRANFVANETVRPRLSCDFCRIGVRAAGQLPRFRPMAACFQPGSVIALMAP